MSYKIQYGLSFIPYFGLLIVIFTSFYNMYKVKKSRFYVFLYYLLLLVPMAIFGVIIFLVAKYFIAGNDPVIMVVLYLALGYICFLCMAVIGVFIEKSMIERLEKEEKQSVTE